MLCRQPKLRDNIAGINYEASRLDDVCIVNRIVVSADKHGMIITKCCTFADGPKAHKVCMFTVRWNYRDVWIQIINLCSPILQQFHDLQRGALPDVRNILLVSETNYKDA